MKISTKKVSAEPITYTPEVLQITVEDNDSLVELRTIAAKMRARNWSLSCNGVSFDEDRIVARFLKKTLGEL